MGKTQPDRLRQELTPPSVQAVRFRSVTSEDVLRIGDESIAPFAEPLPPPDTLT